MINIDDIKITPRDEQVLKLLVQGCSNKEIASQLNADALSPRGHSRRPQAGKARDRNFL